MPEVLVSGGFDDLGSRQVRLLQEAARGGFVRVLLWSDDAVRSATGAPPRFGIDERRYLVESLRYVSAVEVVDGPARIDGITYRAPPDADLGAFPREDASTAPTPSEHPPGARSVARRVVVTGCYDWLHSGHVRFFEEASALGDLHVVVGHDANVRLLKGEGHPRFPQEERRYMVQAVRFVRQALVSSGTGWMDAEPEIMRIGADAYAVNEDGDKPEKREFCRAHGLEYIVLRRTPAPGLPPRTSTDLRGF
jgi:cytidyltransferase-like protein